jgi:hypothetical protein
MVCLGCYEPFPGFDPEDERRYAQMKLACRTKWMGILALIVHDEHPMGNDLDFDDGPDIEVDEVMTAALQARWSNLR